MTAQGPSRDMRTVIVLLTRDLRVGDNPALDAAVRQAERVVPLFVLDPRLPAADRRLDFLAECLADLRGSLRRLGGDLVIRVGDPVTEAIRLALATAASGIVLARDVSAFARRRERRMAQACSTHRLALTLVDSVTVVPPGAVRPTGGGDHYRVFTPYWRAWLGFRRRAELLAPDRIALPDGVPAGSLPAAGRGEGLLPGGERAGRRRLGEWRHEVGDYAARRDDLAADRTSRLSPYLHFGCLSPVSVAAAAGECEAFLRQLCWRDFLHQLLSGFPELPREPYNGRAEQWGLDPEALAAWQAGETGIPIVDAGMRQLAAEGWMHNRARVITASFLTRRLGLDWRDGASWYARWLLDADVANNYGNWQWIAGTGTDTRRHRGFNPLRQAERYDRDGDYVRRWVPELAGVTGPEVHRPWLLPAVRRRGLHYPTATGSSRPPAVRASPGVSPRL